MNCNTYRDQILLEASGELSPKESIVLSKHLGSCGECRDFAKRTNSLTEIYSKIAVDELPHPSVMVNIRQAAEENLKKHELLWFPTHAMRFAAYAAILMFIAGTVLISTTPENEQQNVSAGFTRGIDSPQTSQIPELSTMAALISDRVATDGEDDYIIDESASLEEFAEQLLEMEGFAYDDMFDDEAMLNLFVEPDPTTTQYHKNRVLPAKKCV